MRRDNEPYDPLFYPLDGDDAPLPDDVTQEEIIAEFMRIMSEDNE